MIIHGTTTTRFALVLAGAVLLACTGNNEQKRQEQPVNRIISFAPSITETLFALGLGHKVVGVTRFCAYPPEVKKITSIGGYLDPNYELILTLKPDLVLLLKEHAPLIDFLNSRSIGYALIDNHDVSAIIGSFRQIGRLCGGAAAGDSLASYVEQRLADTVLVRPPPKVLICVGRDGTGSGTVTKLFAAGGATFYRELLDAAGAVNVYTDSTPAYPSFSSEAVAYMAPDIIIDLMASVAGMDPQRVKADWDRMTMVPAVKNRMVFCLSGDHVTIPGPRISYILEDFKRIVRSYRGSIEQDAGI